jgi:hypothetical protein
MAPRQASHVVYSSPRWRRSLNAEKAAQSASLNDDAESAPLVKPVSLAKLQFMEMKLSFE